MYSSSSAEQEPVEGVNTEQIMSRHRRFFSDNGPKQKVWNSQSLCLWGEVLPDLWQPCQCVFCRTPKRPLPRVMSGRSTGGNVFLVWDNGGSFFFLRFIFQFPLRRNRLKLITLPSTCVKRAQPPPPPHPSRNWLNYPALMNISCSSSLKKKTVAIGAVN